MIKKGPRAVAEAIAATMELWLPAQLTAVSAAWSDDLTLPAPYRYYATVQEITPEPTTLEVDCRTGQQRANSAQTSLLEGFGELAYDFTVIINTGGDTETNTIERGQMYQQALWEVFMQHNRLDESLSGLTGIDLSTMGFDFGKTGGLPKYRAVVGWRGVAYVEQSVG